VLVSQRHDLKGEKEQLLSEVLSVLALHRPPCLVLIANHVYYLLAALAYNLMVAIKLLDLGDESQGWRLKTLVRTLVHLPGWLSWRWRQWIACVMLPGRRLSWWQSWVRRVWPEYGPGRLSLTTPAG